MKLLIITPVIPYPLDEGGKVSQFAFLECLQNSLDLHLILNINSDLENDYADQLSQVLPKISVHKILTFKQKLQLEKQPDNEVPLYKKIYWQFYDYLYKSKKNEILVKNIIAGTKTDDFERPIEFLGTYKREIIDKIGKLINDIKPDIIQIEHNAFLNFIEFVNHPKTVFVEHEIQFGRLLSLSKKSLTHFERYKIELNRTIETALLNKYNMVFCFSEDDKKLLQDNAVKTTVNVSPFPIPDEAFRHPTEVQKEIKKTIFVGGSAHYPNQDAIEWYIDHVAKDVYEEVSLKFHIIGKCRNELIEKYRNLEHVVFEGYVEDLFLSCTNSIMVVPLRIGSGIRTKILYGMAQELPIVSTAIGCEGIGVKSHENIIIANNADDIKKEIVSLYHNQDRASNIGKKAYQFVYDNFSQKKLVDKRLDFYTQLLETK